jgi:pSer/pThr/pTyr-binding forkhead associated (FHA) protein/tetratricopeptide (TPR) repeat protein
MVRLVISDNEGTTTVVPLVRDEITIGRKEGNTIRLTERNISRQHAQLVRAAGVYKLRDLDSYNGVSINGRRVSGESDINTGDQIQIGDYTILVEEEATKAEPVDEPTTIAARPLSPARLVMLSEPSPGAEFGLSSERPVRLGRAEDVDCPVAHRSVSREHAEVRCQTGDYVIADLDSANGVTINGQPSRQSMLRAGDIVELGQVVFRFVAPGESYFFDAAEAARYRRGFAIRKGPNVRVIAAVLGVASMVAVAIVMSGGSDVPGESATPLPQAPVQISAAATAAGPADSYDKSVNACRSALNGARFAEAIAHAAMALKVRPDSSDAAECRAEAQLQYEEEQAYVRGRAALASGDPESAYQEFSRLAENSPFRARPEVVTAAEAFARARLSRGRNVLAVHPQEAARAAQTVLDVPGLSSELAGEAEALLAEARRGSEAQVASAARMPAAKPTKPLKPFSATARPAASKPAAPAAPTQSPMDAASACLTRGDNECVIRALNGRANTAQELGLLIETYRAIGDTKQAQKNMATYVKRFPTARRADAYKRMLELQGQ